MSHFSNTAMVLAAGYGKRMLPLTLTRPKPLQLVAGRTMLDRVLDKLSAVGVQRVVVNTFYLAEQIEQHLQTRKDLDIIISREDELLDTGGGIVKALPYFDGKPFFTLNADLPWTDGVIPSLTRLKQQWNPEEMDAILLLMPTAKARGFPPTGDFAMEPDGRVWRQKLIPPRPYVWIGAQILKPELFTSPPGKIFSNNRIWDKAEEQQRLYGLEHQGTCYHIGTSHDLDTANELLTLGKGWGV